MSAPADTAHEARRQGPLDAASDDVFERTARIAAHACRAPIALILLTDGSRQSFKARIGLNEEKARDSAPFGGLAIEGGGPTAVDDTLADPRFSHNPLVCGAPFVRSALAVPLALGDGTTIGTFYVMDTVPRGFDDADRKVLADLAQLAAREVEQRRLIARSDESRARDRYALAVSEARFASVFRHTPTGKAILDLDGRFTDVNPKFCEITGYPADALKACRLADIWHPEHVVTDGEAIVDLLAGRRESYAIEKRCVRQDGKTIWVSLNVAIVRDDTGDPLHFIAVILDVTGRKETEAALAHYRLELEARVHERTAELERSRETLRTIADNLPILIAQVDRSLRYRFNNATYRQLFGVDPTELLGRSLDEVLPSDVYEQLHPYFVRVLAGERVTCPDVCYQPEDDRIWTATYVPDVRRGEVVGFYVMGQDVTEARRAERQLRAKAMQDPLTGLPNRRALIDDLAAAIAATTQRGPFALLFIDLDRFKPVNDALGHDAGDALLIHVAQRLRASVKSSDLVSRLAGDEFVVLARNVAEVATCERIAGAICRSLAAPFSLSGHEVAMSASVGALLCTDAAGLNAEALLAKADAQMYNAKHAGGNRYCVGVSPEAGTR